MTTSWLTAVPPSVAIEIARHRVTVVGVSGGGGRVTVTHQASEALPPDAIRPALTGPTILQPQAVIDALRRAVERAGLVSTRRVALIVPDSLARVSLIPLEHVPARPQDLDQLLRWQLRKTMPFPLDQAQVSHFTAAVETQGTTMATIVARRDVIAEYEAVAAALGMHPGVVDLASFNVINAVMGSGTAMAGDWLLVHLAPESTTLAIVRGASLLFYRHRSADEEPLRALVHQTAMYHEDRLGGGRFTRVLVCGAGQAALDARQEIADRLGVAVEPVDVRGVVALTDQSTPSADTLDALAAPVGALVRDRAA
ncbi:MAG: pilus assembly protein PilM [Vicinamibacterales bacterium]